MTRFIRSLLLLVAASSIASAASCYYPDGTVSTAISPCNSTIAVSACCDPLDACTTSGLCLGASGWIYRSGCTDKNWGPGCPTRCITDLVTTKTYSSFTPIWPCSAGQGTTLFCCDVGSNSGKGCCGSNFTLGNTGHAFKAGQDAVEQSISSLLVSATAGVTASASSVTTTLTVTKQFTSSTDAAAGAAATTSQSSASNATCSSSPNLGVAIGAGVGVPLGALALGVLAFLVWRERRKSRAVDAQAAAMAASHGPAPSTYDGTNASMHQTYMEQPQSAYKQPEGWPQNNPSPTAMFSPDSASPNHHVGETPTAYQGPHELR